MTADPITETLSKETILKALEHVKHPNLDDNIVALGLISEIVIHNAKVYFSIKVATSRAAALEPLRQAAQSAVEAVSGVHSATVTLTASREPGASQPEPSAIPPKGFSPQRPAAPPHPAKDASLEEPKSGISEIDAIIAVASGKGGVGKSTTAVNLALSLKASGLRVGILDADIYGPSLPRLLGLTGQPEQTENRRLKPLEAYGLKIMSIGFLVDEDSAMIWRGPMVMSALTQMLKEVNWGALDVLVVDMPPGTGDAQLTMAQQVPLAGAVIVSTPQDLALIDARRGLNMFRRVDVPVLGLIENMSYFLCPKCGERAEIFGHGGASIEARKLSLEFLGEIPLHMDIRTKSDAGQPVVVSDPDGPLSSAYKEIATKVWQGVKDHRKGPEAAAPNIIIES